jgi:hypothetical protein
MTTLEAASPRLLSEMAGALPGKAGSAASA